MTSVVGLSYFLFYHIYIKNHSKITVVKCIEDTNKENTNKEDEEKKKSVSDDQLNTDILKKQEDDLNISSKTIHENLAYENTENETKI